jgi:N-acetyl-anhydromuramyl-L-alanine amidase AmpD
MPVCPFAANKLIAPGSNDPRIQPRVAILHVDAGNAESLYDYFKNRSGGIESHFHIKKSGEIEQYRDTDFQADANHNANDFAISIETQGYGSGEWTPAQVESIKKLLVWLNKTHPAIRLQKAPAWDGTGVGYHVQFGAPGAWTPVAKSCPGPDRIRQFEAVIVPWLKTVSRVNSKRRSTPTWLRKELHAAKRRARTEKARRLIQQLIRIVRKERG